PGGCATGFSGRSSTRCASASGSMPSRHSSSTSGSGRCYARRSPAWAISSGCRAGAAPGAPGRGTRPRLPPRARPLRRRGAAATGLPGPLLGRLIAALDPLPEVSGEITATLVETPPPHTRIPGFIRPGCHPEVDALRDAARDGKGWLARFETEERRRTGITSLKVRYNKVFGYYVEVTKPNLPQVPADYERKQTLVGAERFITPGLKEHEARVLGAEERLRSLEQHLFAALVDSVASRHPSLARTAEALATLDALVSLAEVAHRRGWVRPRLTREPALRVR